MPELISPSDFLVLNDSRVFPARLLGHRESGGQVEVLLLRPAIHGWDSQTNNPKHGAVDDRGERCAAGRATWEVLARPRRKLHPGCRLYFASELTAVVVETPSRDSSTTAHRHGEKLFVEFQFPGDFYAVLEKIGHVPLPPYIRRSDSLQDRQRYQTIYARPPGSAAAPTAGLHFTPIILDQLRSKRIDRYFVTLHVGYGTFRPVKTDTIEGHHVDPEPFDVSPVSACGIRQALECNRRLIAVGTTTTRVLEHWRRQCPTLQPLTGETDLFIYPPFRFQIVQGLLTNFHLPRSSLFALVCAFLGTDLARACYRHAVEQRYRFYSYGDCMLIL